MNNKYDYLYARYLGPRGYEGHQLRFMSFEKAGNLKVGTLYKVEKIDMGSSFTGIDLQNVGKGLNSVAFDFYEIKNKSIKKIDIYNDERYNPYMREM